MAGEIASTRNGTVTRNSDGSVSGRVLGNGRGGSPPRTEYVLVEPKGSQQAGPTRRWAASYTPSNRPGAGYGGGFLANRGVVFYAWLAAMAVVCWDEWHSNNILPRPARLWDTSLTYLLLGAVSAIDMAVPLANALALGYLLVLLYQYYNKTGQFG